MYRLTSTAVVVRVADGLEIPSDPTNMDRVDYEAWLAEGGVPEPYVAPPPAVPQAVSKRQALQALILAGLDDEVEALLDGMTGVAGKMARAEWRESNNVERNRPLVIQLGAQLGLDAAALDALFIQAGGLQ